MKSILLSLSLLALVACEAPTRTRTGLTNGNSYQPGTTSGNNGGSNPWTGGGTVGTTDGGQQNNGLPPGFENCDISQKHYASGINYIGICQSKNSETQIAANPSVTNTSVRTCLVPTYKTGNGASTYLGQPQCFYPRANEVTVGTLVKTRPGFTGNPISGVMVLLETSIEAYYTCMNAYSNYINNNCPAFPQACAAQATQVMNSICNNFKSTHSYIDLCVNTTLCSNN